MAKDSKQPDAEPKPLQQCAGCRATTFEVKRLAQVRGADFVNEQYEVRCVVCGRLLVMGA